MFTDFVSQLLTIDPDGRPTAEEALKHPWMQYAATLTEAELEEISARIVASVTKQTGATLRG